MIQEEGLILGTLIGTLILLFTSITIFVFFIYYQKYAREREKLKIQQQHLQTELDIQETTFKTISQEIHDNIGQLLSLAKLNLNTADVEQPFQTKDKIEQSKELISKSITALRDLSKSLNAEMIKEIGLSESIRRELSLLSNSGHIKTSFTEKGQPYRIDKQKELVLFRIFQETIQNIIKHSNARTVMVLLGYEPDFFLLEIVDDGIGFTVDNISSLLNGNGLGIRNIQNRAYLIGAELKLASGEGKGTTVSLMINNLT